MSGLVCPDCSQGPEKCKCDNGHSLDLDKFKIKICSDCNTLLLCCNHSICYKCKCKKGCYYNECNRETRAYKTTSWPRH